MKAVYKFIIGIVVTVAVLLIAFFGVYFFVRSEFGIDLFQFRNLTGKRFKLTETYLKKYGASGDCEDKLAFYGLWNEVYCFIRSGVLIPTIMNPLVRNMKRRLNR